MRVIAGTRKSLPLKTLPGNDTRPTTDRIKETLFNMINPYIYECRFLDIFAGSGGIGIEALSRGAVCCCMIEKNQKAIAVIKENLKKTDFLKETKVICGDAVRVFEKPNSADPFDVIFMDPPYNKGLEKVICEKLSVSDWVAEDALFIIEASLETDFSWANDIGLEIIKEKLYKTNKHMFLKRMPEAE